MATAKKIPAYTLLSILIFFNFASCSPNSSSEPSPTIQASPSPVPLSFPSGTGGGVIAFVSDRTGGRMDLYLVNADGSELTQITHTRNDEIAPSWSPDGTQLAYLVSKFDQLQLVILDIDAALADPETDHSRLLVEDSVDASPPTWSVDGTVLFYAASQDGILDLYMINSDGTGKSQISNSTHDIKHPSLSPDGTKLAYSANQSGSFDLYLIKNFNNQEIQDPEPIQLTVGTGDELFPTWSSGGERILYTTSENGNKDIAIVHWQTNSSFSVLESSADEWKASWSPDNTQIVYSYFNFDNSLNDLFIHTLDSVNSFQITSDNFDNWWPAWKP